MKTEVIEVLPRAGQVVFSAVCVATASSLVYQIQQHIPVGVLVALCSAGIGLLWSMFRIIVPVCSRKVGKALPGLIDMLISASFAGTLIAAGAVTAAAGACHALADGTALIVPRTGSGPLLGNSSSASVPPSIGSANFVIPPRIVHTNVGQPLQLPQPPSNPAVSTAALSSAAAGRRRRLLLLQDMAGSLRSSSSSNDGDVPFGGVPGLRRLLLSDKPTRNPALLLCSAWDATITLCFINFMFYAISAAIGILDMRLGKGVLVFKRKTAAAKEAELAGQDDVLTGGVRVRGVLGPDQHEFDGDADVIIVPLSQLANSNAGVTSATAAWGRASLDRLMLQARVAAEARGQA